MDASHRPVICPIASKWMIAKEDSGTSQWIKVGRSYSRNVHEVEANMSVS